MTSDSRPAVLDLIGNTPLVRVTRFDTGPCTSSSNRRTPAAPSRIASVSP